MSAPSSIITIDVLYQALRYASRPTPKPSPLIGLKCVQHRLLEETGHTTAEQERTAVNAMLQQALVMLERENPELAAILQMRYIEGQGIAYVQVNLGVKEDTVKKALKKGSELLVPIVADLEQTAVASHAQRLLDILGKPVYGRRVGTADLPAVLAEQLITGGRNLVITGMGGLGKTTLADATIRHALQAHPYQRVHTIKVAEGELTVDTFQQKLAQALNLDPNQEPAKRNLALRHWLKTIPHLILVDNLEQDISGLVDEVEALSDPSHFVITVRQKPTALGRIFIHELSELLPHEAAELLREEAERQQRPELVGAPTADLQQIYQHVGGNPLALKLIVTLNHTATVPQILADLRQAKHSTILQMYMGIYAKVWETLNPVSRGILQTMPYISNEGAPRELIADTILGARLATSEMAVYDALDVLVQRSLVQTTGAAWDASYLYSIHNLTKTFVMDEVIQAVTNSQ